MVVIRGGNSGEFEGEVIGEVNVLAGIPSQMTRKGADRGLHTGGDSFENEPKEEATAEGYCPATETSTGLITVTTVPRKGIAR